MWNRDLYTIQAPPLPTYTPTKVTTYGTFKKIGPHTFTLMAILLIRTHDTTFYHGIEYVEDFNWNLFSWDLDKNPATGEDWTPAEISNLQIGVSLGMYKHVEWYSTSACTQLYAKISYATP